MKNRTREIVNTLSNDCFVAKNSKAQILGIEQ